MGSKQEYETRREKERQDMHEREMRQRTFHADKHDREEQLFEDIAFIVSTVAMFLQGQSRFVYENGHVWFEAPGTRPSPSRTTEAEK